MICRYEVPADVQRAVSRLTGAWSLDQRLEVNIVRFGCRIFYWKKRSTEQPGKGYPERRGGDYSGQKKQNPSPSAKLSNIMHKP